MKNTHHAAVVTTALAITLVLSNAQSTYADFHSLTSKQVLQGSKVSTGSKFSISQEFEDVGTLDSPWDLSNPYTFANLKNTKAWTNASRNILITNHGKIITAVKNVVAVGSYSEGFYPVEIGSSWNFIGNHGNLLATKNFDSYRNFQSGMAAEFLHGRWGFVNTTGKQVIPNIYDDVKDFVGNFAFVEVNGRWGVVNKNGKVITSPIFEDLEVAKSDDSLWLVAENGAWGVYNLKLGMLITQPQLQIDSFNATSHPDNSNELFDNGPVTAHLPPKSDNFYQSAILDTSGAITAITNNQLQGKFSEGLILFQTWCDSCEIMNAKYGFMNSAGTIVIPANFYQASNFSDGLAAVFTLGADGNDVRGYIDKSGSIVIQSVLSLHSEFGLFPFHGDAAVGTLNGENYGVMNRSGNLILKPSSDVIASDSVGTGLNSNLFLFGPTIGGSISDQGYGIMDDSGKITQQPFARFILPVSKNLVKYQQRDRFGFLDSSGNFLGHDVYDEIRPESNGMVPVRIGDQWGFVSDKGQVVVTPGYKDVAAFSNGYAAFSADGMNYGYINTKGTVVVSPRFTQAGPFINGAAVVILKDGNKAIIWVS